MNQITQSNKFNQERSYSICFICIILLFTFCANITVALSSCKDITNLKWKLRCQYILKEFNPDYLISDLGSEFLDNPKAVNELLDFSFYKILKNAIKDNCQIYPQDSLDFNYCRGIKVGIDLEQEDANQCAQFKNYTSCSFCKSFQLARKQEHLIKCDRLPDDLATAICHSFREYITSDSYKNKIKKLKTTETDELTCIDKNKSKENEKPTKKIKINDKTFNTLLEGMSDLILLTFTDSKNRISNYTSCIDKKKLDVDLFNKISTERKDHLLANVLGDFYIKGTSFEGNTFSNTLQYYQNLITHLISTDVNQNLDPKFKAIQEELTDAIKLNNSILKISKKSVNSLNKFTPVIKNFKNKLTKLKIGQGLIWPASFENSTGGHAFIVRFVATEDNKYKVQIINTGDGLQYHSTKITNDLKKDITLEYSNVQFNDLKDKIFVDLIKIGTRSGRDYQAQDVYDLIFSSLQANKDIKNIPSTNWHKGQHSGTCSARVIEGFIYTILKDNPSAFSRYQLLSDGHALQHGLQLLKEDNFVSEKNKLIFSEFLKRASEKYSQTIVSAQVLQDKGTSIGNPSSSKKIFSSEEKRWAEQTILDVTDFLKEITNEDLQTKTHPPQVSFSSEIPKVKIIENDEQVLDHNFTELFDVMIKSDHNVWNKHKMNSIISNLTFHDSKYFPSESTITKMIEEFPFPDNDNFWSQFSAEESFKIIKSFMDLNKMFGHLFKNSKRKNNNKGINFSAEYMVSSFKLALISEKLARNIIPQFKDYSINIQGFINLTKNKRFYLESKQGRDNLEKLLAYVKKRNEQCGITDKVLFDYSKLNTDGTIDNTIINDVTKTKVADFILYDKIRIEYDLRHTQTGNPLNWSFLPGLSFNFNHDKLSNFIKSNVITNPVQDNTFLAKVKTINYLGGFYSFINSIQSADDKQEDQNFNNRLYKMSMDVDYENNGTINQASYKPYYGIYDSSAEKQTDYSLSSIIKYNLSNFENDNDFQNIFTSKNESQIMAQNQVTSFLSSDELKDLQVAFSIPSMTIPRLISFFDSFRSKLLTADYQKIFYIGLFNNIQFQMLNADYVINKQLLELLKNIYDLAINEGNQQTLSFLTRVLSRVVVHLSNDKNNRKAFTLLLDKIEEHFKNKFQIANNRDPQKKDADILIPLIYRYIQKTEFKNLSENDLSKVLVWSQHLKNLFSRFPDIISNRDPMLEHIFLRFINIDRQLGNFLNKKNPSELFQFISKSIKLPVSISKEKNIYGKYPNYFSSYSNSLSSISESNYPQLTLGLHSLLQTQREEITIDGKILYNVNLKNINESLLPYKSYKMLNQNSPILLVTIKDKKNIPTYWYYPESNSISEYQNGVLPADKGEWTIGLAKINISHSKLNTFNIFKKQYPCIWSKKANEDDGTQVIHFPTLQVGDKDIVANNYKFKLIIRSDGKIALENDRQFVLQEDATIKNPAIPFENFALFQNNKGEKILLTSEKENIYPFKMDKDGNLDGDSIARQFKLAEFQINHHQHDKAKITIDKILYQRLSTKEDINASLKFLSTFKNNQSPQAVSLYFQVAYKLFQQVKNKNEFSEMLNILKENSIKIVDRYYLLNDFNNGFYFRIFKNSFSEFEPSERNQLFYLNFLLGKGQRTSKETFSEISPETSIIQKKLIKRFSSYKYNNNKIIVPTKNQTLVPYSEYLLGMNLDIEDNYHEEWHCNVNNRFFKDNSTLNLKSNFSLNSLSQLDLSDFNTYFDDIYNIVLKAPKNDKHRDELKVYLENLLLIKNNDSNREDLWAVELMLFLLTHNISYADNLKKEFKKYRCVVNDQTEKRNILTTTNKKFGSSSKFEDKHIQEINQIAEDELKKRITTDKKQMITFNKENISNNVDSPNISDFAIPNFLPDVNSKFEQYSDIDFTEENKNGKLEYVLQQLEIFQKEYVSGKKLNSKIPSKEYEFPALFGDNPKEEFNNLDNLLKFKEHINKSIIQIKEKKNLISLDILNLLRKNSSTLDKTIELEDAIALFVKGNYNDYRNFNKHLSNLDIDRLYHKTAEFLLVSINLQKYNRIIPILDKIKVALEKNKSTVVSEFTQKLKEEIVNNRVYDYTKNPALLVLEWKNDFQLRARQVSLLNKMCNQKDNGDFNDLLFEESCGSGKTSVISTVANLKHADGFHLSVYMMPKSQISVGAQGVKEYTKKAFNQKGNIIEFQATPNETTSSHLTYLLENLLNIIKQKEYIIISPESVLFMQQYRDLLAEKLHLTDKETLKTSNKEELTKYQTIKNILYLFKERGVVVGDEVDDLLHPKHESNTAISSKKLASKKDIYLISSIMHYLANNRKINKSLQLVNGNAHQLSPIVKKAIIYNLAYAFCDYEDFGLKSTTGFDQDRCAQFVKYVTGILSSKKDSKDSNDKVPTWLHELHKQHQQHQQDQQNKVDNEYNTAYSKADMIVLFKYYLTKILPSIFNEKIEESYGLENGIAIPFSKGVPMKDSEIANVQEKLAKSLSGALFNGINPSDIKSFVAYLKKRVDYDLSTNEYKNINDSKLIKNLQQLFKIPLDQIWELNENTLIDVKNIFSKIGNSSRIKTLEDLNLRNDFIIDFYRDKKLHDVSYYPNQFKGNGHDILYAFKNFQGMSGTITPASLPLQLRESQDEYQGSVGKIVDKVISNPKNQVHIVQSLQIEKLLSDLYTNKKNELLEVGQILDISGEYNELSHQVLAKNILKFFKSKSPPFKTKGVLFFNQNGELFCLKDNQIIALKTTDPEEIKSKVGLKKNELFTLFHQSQTRASNFVFKKDSKALAIIDGNINTSDLIQGIMRMRGLIKDQSVLCLLNKKSAQIIRDELQKNEKDDGPITMVDLFKYSKIAGPKRDLDNNYRTTIQALNDVVRKYIYNKRHRNSDIFKDINLYTEFRDILIEDMNFFPYDSFREIEQMRPTEKILEDIKDKLLNKVKIILKKISDKNKSKSGSENETENENLRSEVDILQMELDMINILNKNLDNLLTEMLSLGSEDGNGDSNSNLQISVKQNVETTVEVQQEVKQEVKQQANIQVDDSLIFKEMLWGSNVNLSSLTLPISRSDQHPSVIALNDFFEKYENQSMQSIQSIQSKRHKKSTQYKQFKNGFSDKIFISENFIHTLDSNTNSSGNINSTELLSLQQKNVFNILLLKDQAIIITNQEAESLSKILNTSTSAWIINANGNLIAGNLELFNQLNYHTSKKWSKIQNDLLVLSGDIVSILRSEDKDNILSNKIYNNWLEQVLANSPEKYLLFKKSTAKKKE
ncbi:MAG: DUF3638 domain-containing protein, partial [Oligoflexia bacterium]|nr:DUF3638 domain-containing protein [Oligoflexia bacterium]